jgi:hypothetical protein
MILSMLGYLRRRIADFRNKEWRAFNTINTVGLLTLQNL